MAAPCGQGSQAGGYKRIKGSQDIVLFKEEGDIYCLKKRKTERHKKNIEKNKDTCTHDRRQTQDNGMETREVRSGWGWAWLALKVTAKE